MKNILWKKLSGSEKYNSFVISQRIFILRKNPPGVSFIGKADTNCSRHFHPQLSEITRIPLPGCFAACPVTKSFMESYNIEFQSKDRCRKFQSDGTKYLDNIMYYETNEPTITSIATANFVFGNY